MSCSFIICFPFSLLFLDEHFAKPSIRLAQLTNKCNNGEDDLDYYIQESGEILGNCFVFSMFIVIYSYDIELV